MLKCIVENHNLCLKSLYGQHAGSIPVMSDQNRDTFQRCRQQKRLIALVVKRHMIHHKAKLMQQTVRILHFWHLVHQPFVIIMFLILLVHIYVAVRLGYVWLF